MPEVEREIEVARQVARNTFNKTRRVNLRMTERDFTWRTPRLERKGFPTRRYCPASFTSTCPGVLSSPGRPVSPFAECVLPDLYFGDVGGEDAGGRLDHHLDQVVRGDALRALFVDAGGVLDSQLAATDSMNWIDPPSEAAITWMLSSTL